MCKVYKRLFFRVITSAEAWHVCITWMTPQMRKDLIWFGDMLLLDVQERKFIKWGFPCCTFTMIDHVNTVAIDSETLYCAEGHDRYTNMIECTLSVEPSWYAKTGIVFDDKMIDYQASFT